MTQPQNHNNDPVTYPKDMGFCDVPDKEFKELYFKEEQ